MSVYTTEIASDQITSDNPIHQRLLFPYIYVAPKLSGHVLEVGCGQGRGVRHILPKVRHFMAIDKIESAINSLKQQYPEAEFIATRIPPFSVVPSNTFDAVISFQVIEHIKNDALYLQEISRVLKPGGVAYITTPNRPMSLSRNPWHVREYLADELQQRAAPYFSEARVMGIAGNHKVMEYYEQNKKSVQRIMRWDILNLQYTLPGSLLRLPYEILNRMNRNKLSRQDTKLVNEITVEDFFTTETGEVGIDLFLVATK